MASADLILQALAPYGLHKESGNEWRCNSPLRPGSNSHAFKVHIDADGDGTYFDHVSGDKGTLGDLAGLLGIQIERRTATATKRGYQTLAEYAEAHHIPADVLAKNGWSDAQTYQNRPALTFKTATGLRYRFIDGDKPYYKSENGYRSCWYGLKRAMELASETGQALVLCNGEVSTLAAQNRGVAACAVTAGEKELAKALVDELLKRWQGQVILAYDCDDTGRSTAVKVREQLRVLNPKIVDLGLTDGGDLADFCALYEGDSAGELQRRTAQIASLPPVPNRTDVEQLADAIKELRGALAEQGQDIETLTAVVQSELDRIKARTSRPVVMGFDQIARENLELIDFRRQNPSAILGLKSNIPTLDRAIGGFEPEMYVIYGATSMGKSTLAVSFAREFLKQAPGFIATTESNPRRWMMKLVGSMTSIPSDRVESGRLSDGEYQAVRDAYGLIASMGCQMLEHGSPSVSVLRAALLAGIQNYGYEWVIIDSVSKMDAPGSIYDTTRAISNGLQTLWQELNIPFIVTSQVGRDVSERPAGKKMPLLEDAYGGGTIEQNAGVVLGLYNHQYYVETGAEEADEVRYPPNTALVRVLKNRWRGDARVSSVQLKFVGGAGFYELKTETTAQMLERTITL